MRRWHAYYRSGRKLKWKQASAESLGGSGFAFSEGERGQTQWSD